MVRQVSVRGITIQADKLLCVRLKPYTESLAKSKPFWCLPGGGLDDGEALLDGIRREMIEETGVEPKVGRLLYVQQFTRPDTDKDFLEFFFHIENATDYLNVDLDRSTHGTAEIEEIAFIDPRSTPSLLPDFLQTESLSEFVHSNQPTKFFVRYPKTTRGQLALGH